MVGVSVGHENFDPLQGEHPLLRQIGPAAVAVARHHADGEGGKAAGELLRQGIEHGGFAAAAVLTADSAADIQKYFAPL